MEDFYDVVIVGAGHGGAQAAIALRQRQFTGSIALVGDEPDPPYERPPLSKDYLEGAKPFERILIRPRTFWADKGIVLLLNRRIEALDGVKRLLTLHEGNSIGYGTLIWAAGGVPRSLDCPGNGLAGVHSVRRRADVDRLVGQLGSTEAVVVVGGGYIGLEAAAVLTKLGKRVTVLEAADRVLSRVAGQAISAFYEAEHLARGVSIRHGVVVSGIEGEDGRAVGVRLETGEVIPADLVIVGIGIAPSVEPLLAAGARGGNGVSVDEFCRTTITDVYAIGDCAQHANHFAGGAQVRIESVQNANDQANVAVGAITGSPSPYQAVPWFWSNQYDLRLQTVGLSLGNDQSVLRGDPAERSFSVIYLRRGAVIALDCVNATKDYVAGKALVMTGAVVAPELLADVSIPLRNVG